MERRWSKLMEKTTMMNAIMKIKIKLIVHELRYNEFNSIIMDGKPTSQDDCKH